MSLLIFTTRRLLVTLSLTALPALSFGACSSPKPARVPAASAKQTPRAKQETSTKQGSLSGTWRASYFWSNGGTSGDVRIEYEFTQDGEKVTGTRKYYEKESDNNAEITECEILAPLTGELKGDQLKLTMGLPTEKSEGCEKFEGPENLDLTWDPELGKLIETVWGGPEEEEKPLEFTRE
jgi:hypothetical protein